jgi:hypothetical protein
MAPNPSTQAGPTAQNSTTQQEIALDRSYFHRLLTKDWQTVEQELLWLARQKPATAEITTTVQIAAALLESFYQTGKGIGNHLPTLPFFGHAIWDV